MTPESQHPRQSPHAGADPLLWQSRLLGLVILPTCGAWLILYANQFWTRATVEGLAICAAFGVLVWRLKAATGAGSTAGILLTATMYLATVVQPRGGWLHTALLPGLVLFVLAFLATRFRRDSKEGLGTAESTSGRRTSQIVANLGAAALAGIWMRAHPAGGVTAMMAALAEATADTVSSEIGQVLGGAPRLITTLQRVPAGTDGGVSLPGTVAGIVAAVVVVLVAVPCLRLDPRLALIAWSGGVMGLFMDSLLGATLERRGWLNNDMVNFLATLTATLAAANAAPW